MNLSHLPQFKEFSAWLGNNGNRNSTIERKIRYLKQLNTLEPNEVFKKNWTDKVKKHCLDVMADYAKFLNIPFNKPTFRVYDNREMYVPSPEMIRTFLYRVHSVRVRARIKIAVECGASSGEVWRLT